MIDHDTLKSLPNTLQPSGKLTRWGKALYELDLTIVYCSGRKNRKADALSCYPVPQEGLVEEIPPPPMIATTTPSFNKSQSRNCQGEHKYSDPELMEIVRFLEEGTLPDDDKRAHVLVLNKPQHTMVEKGLYHIALDKTLQIVLPLGIA